MLTVNKREFKDMEILIAEVERNLSVLKDNYQKAVSNLDELRRCAEVDDLTRFLRRNAFITKVANLLLESKQQDKEVQIMMIDLDHFKKINDQHGHQTGDKVLENVSNLIRTYLRPQDYVGRYGGEEIIVAMQCPIQNTVEIAERIRTAVERFHLTEVTGFGSAVKVTLSIGIASSASFGYTLENLVSEADKALYRAKNEGRNQVRLEDLNNFNQRVQLVVENAGAKNTGKLTSVALEEKHSATTPSVTFDLTKIAKPEKTSSIIKKQSSTAQDDGPSAA